MIFSEKNRFFRPLKLSTSVSEKIIKRGILLITGRYIDYGKYLTEKRSLDEEHRRCRQMVTIQRRKVWLNEYKWERIVFLRFINRGYR